MAIVSHVVDELAQCIFTTRAIVIRDVDGGEEPFIYSSGNKGPGYIMLKGLVSQRPLLKALVYQLAHEVLERFPDVEYVAGNATGGMIPGWIMAEALSDLTAREIPYLYVRETRKLGGHKELITGDKQSSFFRPGRRGLVVEELVNFAETTTNSARVQREVGYDVRHAATIVSYDHSESRRLLEQNGIELVYLLTVRELLTIAKHHGYELKLVDSWLSFLDDPIEWQRKRGLLQTGSA